MSRSSVFRAVARCFRTLSLVVFDLVRLVFLAAHSHSALDACLPEQLDVHLIVDNYSTHKHRKVRTWLAQRPRYHIHYTPTYSSWLNQVERWFG
jgi:DDE superfamily endonuclease